ncbi:MAG: hypothetical protein ACXWUG_13310 [Polyangiales bacterium]
MERRSSSEIGILAALSVLSIASSAMLVASPLFAAGASQLVFGATDAMAARVVGLRSPSAAMRVGARALAAATWGGAVSAIATVHTTAVPRLLFLATALLFGLVVGAYGAAGGRTGPTRGPAIEGPLVAVCDALTAAWCFVLSLTAHDAELRTRATLAAGIALALMLRALVVARIVAAASEDRGTPKIAAIGFVAWLAVSAVACTFAASPTTWSGLGAAVVLTVAAVLAELRRKRALVVFLRGSLAFAVAAMLGIATFLSG